MEKYRDVLLEYEKFWERKNTARPILNMSYVKDSAAVYRAPKSPEEEFLDIEYRYNAFKHNVQNSGYLGEGIPLFFSNYGPGCMAACLGGSFSLSRGTVWFGENPIIEDWDNPPKVIYNEDNILWRSLKEMQKKCASDADVYFSITDIGGVMDVISALRGTEDLLYDLYDYPDELKEFSRKIAAAWFRAYDQQAKTLREAGVPYNTWMNIPSSKPWYPLQCDFGYMINPKHYEEFVLPDIIDEVNYLDRSIYHLDGVGQLPHVDMLLDIEKLGGIQWVPGSGSEPLTDEKWFPLYRKIQDKKKNIVMNFYADREIYGLERLVKSIDPVGVYLQIDCSSREIAEDIYEKICVWSQ